MPSFIDLFCGVGGIRLGMEAQGFKCVMSSEIDKDCRETYAANFKEAPLGDIRSIRAEDVPDHDILCAGFPCQPFSISGLKKGFGDTRGTMFFEICRIAEKKRPEVIFLENVKNLIYHDGGRTFDVIVKSLEELGYTVSWDILNAVDFGLPQNRERVFIAACRDRKFDFSRIGRKERRTIEDILDTEGDFEYLDPSEYTLLPSPAQNPGSGLIFAGYRNRPARKNGVRPGTLHLSRAHKQPNRIYSSLGTHPALSSQETSGRYYILTRDGRVRKLTLNECWKLMGFPKEFIKTASKSGQYRQTGNSVCVPVITAIAEEMDRQLFRS